MCAFCVSNGLSGGMAGAEQLLPSTKFVNPGAAHAEKRYGEDPLRRIRRQAGFGEGKPRRAPRSELRYLPGQALALTRTRTVPWATKR